MIDELAKAIADISELEPRQVLELFERPKNREHGDLAIACFRFAKSWKLAPPECAARLKQELSLPSSISEAIVVGPYLNFRLERASFIKPLLEGILKAGLKVGAKEANGKTVIIEYSAPNIAKTFHVGHLRTTLIGHSLVQIYKHLGYEVVGINHLGDWGTQFGFVWAGCELWGRPEDPSVEALVELYRKATQLKKSQETGEVESEDSELPDVNQMARQYFLELEAGEDKAVDFWRWCLDISIRYLKSMYQRLGIHFDHYTGESFYRDMLEDVENKVRESNILEDSEGALGVDLGKKLGFARIFTEDGRSLYITRDIATAFYRYETFSPKEIIYVVAAQQSLHFKQLIGILEKMKHPVASLINHVAFGFVPGMSTREGGAISLQDYLEEAHSRALQCYQSEVSKRPAGIDEEQIAEAVAIGATYFYFLCHSNIKDFNFSWQNALNFQGDSGPYLQYAVARINSVEEKAKQEGLKVSSEIDATLLKEDEAFELSLLLSDWEQILNQACENNEPHFIANYLLSVAKAFSRAYKSLKVVGVEKELAQTRLALFCAARNVLSVGLQLIGVPVVKKM